MTYLRPAPVPIGIAEAAKRRIGRTWGMLLTPRADQHCAHLWREAEVSTRRVWLHLAQLNTGRDVHSWGALTEAERQSLINTLTRMIQLFALMRESYE